MQVAVVSLHIFQGNLDFQMISEKYDFSDAF